MNILVAEDDAVLRCLLEELLVQWGHTVVSAADGRQALHMLQQEDAPRLAILDWMMPALNGPDVCRALRAGPQAKATYILLLTAKSGTGSIVAGLRSGADDYLVKPCDPDELHARLNVGIRLVQAQQSLAERVHELEEALAQVKRLQGLVPICSWCKKVRNDQNYWQQVEAYVSERSEAQFTHGICPECYEKVIGEGSV